MAWPMIRVSRPSDRTVVRISVDDILSYADSSAYGVGAVITLASRKSVLEVVESASAIDQKISDAGSPP